MKASEAIKHLKYLRTGMAIEALSQMGPNPERSKEARARAEALDLAITALERADVIDRQRAAAASSFANYGFLAPHDEIDPNGSSFGSDP
jgi:hypothetical protein